MLPTNHDREATEALCRAAGQGNQAEVKRQLAAGADPNSCTRSGSANALMLAADITIVDLLLQAGAQVAWENDLGNDALRNALDEENRAVVERLVQAGANLNRRNQHGWTRLREAAFSRNPQAVALLLELGADPTLDRGKLLSAASWYGSAGYQAATAKTIDLLIAAGEDVHATDEHGYTALHCAVHGFAYTPSDEEWWNASSDGSDITATQTLLRHSADPNLAGNNGMTPLLLAVESHYESTPCVKALLAAGADIEKAGHGGITPLMRAAHAGQAEIVELLLAEGANAQCTDNFGHDAAHYAAQHLASIQAEFAEVEAEADDEEWWQTQIAQAERCVVLLAAVS